MVLHHVPNDAYIIEIPTSPLGAEWFFKRDLDGLDGLFVPWGVQKRVPESQDKDILDQFFPKVMVDPINLFLFEQWGEIILQLPCGIQVPPERFLHYHPGDCPVIIDQCLNPFSNREEHTWW